MADHEPFSKVVVITGCSSGIGLHTAVCLAAETGFKVIATMRNLQKMGDLEEAAGESMNKSLFIEELDISKEDSILAFVKATLEKEGRIDVLIKYAFEAVTMEKMQTLFRTNVFGTVRLTQEVVRRMKERESCRIINVSSISAFAPLPFADLYNGSKCALKGIFESLAPILRQFNIFVTSIEPGPVQSAIRTNSVKNNLSTVGWSVDDEDGFDGKTNTIRRTYLKGRAHSVHNIGTQTAAEVAEVIKKCIYEEKPSFRIQTSEAVVECAKRFLVDPSGDEANEEISRSIGMTE